MGARCPNQLGSCPAETEQQRATSAKSDKDFPLQSYCTSTEQLGTNGFIKNPGAYPDLDLKQAVVLAAS